MRREIDAALTGEALRDYLEVWSHDDFLSIASAFDRMMVAQGWATIPTTQDAE